MNDSVIFVGSNSSEETTPNNEVEVVNFQDFLTETTTEKLASKRKRVSDADAIEKKKKKLSNCFNTGKNTNLKQTVLKPPKIEANPSDKIKFVNINKKKKEHRSDKQTSNGIYEVKKINGNTKNYKTKLSNIDGHAKKTKHKNHLSKSKNVPRGAIKSIQNEKKIGKSDSDEIADIKVIKAATNLDAIPKLTPVKLKTKTLLSETPLKNECILWSEKYAPKSHSQLLGRKESIDKLHRWLSEWKKYIDKEILIVESKKKKSYESDDDFEFDGIEKDDESRLCRTMLLIGPPGCGKTAAIYSCAQALGFKVNEMNSSSVRDKRQVLSKLHEATQSHQLAKEETESGIKSFFQQVKDKKSKSPTEKFKSSDKRLCLILLEEVDILYEDDRFFWTAVEILTSTSKRPIILTTNDPAVSSNFEDRFEKLTFKPPSTNTLCKQLLFIDGNENSFLNSDEKLPLAVELMKNDIRQCIHSLQFWTGNKLEFKRKKNRKRKNKRLSMTDCTANTGQQTTKELFGNLITNVMGIENILQPAALNKENLFGCITRLSLPENHSCRILHLQNCLYHMHMHKLPVVISLNWDLFLNILQPKTNSNKSLLIAVDPTTTIPNVENESYDLLKLAHGEENLNPKLENVSKIETNGEPESPSKSNLTSLKTISKLCDDLAFSDTVLSNYLQASNDYYKTSCKLLDDLDCATCLSNANVSYKMESSSAELSSLIELYSFSKCQTIFNQNEDYRSDSNQPNNLRTNHSISSQRKFYSSMQNLFDNNYLTQSKAFALDTMPALRCICRAQDTSQRGKLKRRFLHYFNKDLMIHPKQQQMVKLSTDFTEQQK